jgi:hypothetical protein
MKQAREEGIEQGKVVDAIIASLSPDYQNELVSMANSGHWIDAAHKFEKEHQVELTIAGLRF